MYKPKPPVVLIHGFASTGKHDVDLLAEYFEAAGHEVILFHYGFKGFFGVTFGYDREAKRLAQIAPPGCYVAAHSHGAVVFQHASTKYRAPFAKGLLISPALDNKAEFGPSLEKIIVLYSKGDIATTIAQYIPFHPWGNLGSIGYRGSDPRVISYDKYRDFDMKSWGHLDLFWVKHKLEYFGPLFVRLLNE